MTKHYHVSVSRESYFVIMNLLNTCEDKDILVNLVIADPAAGSEFGIVQIVVNGLKKYVFDN